MCVSEYNSIVVMEKKNHELRRLLEAVERTLTKNPVKALATGKLTRYLKGLEKPSRETLDRISLFVGFQDWEGFKEALYGEDDGQNSFGEDAGSGEHSGRDVPSGTSVERKD